MKYDILFQRITELGSTIIEAGADGGITTRKIEILSGKYGFTETDFYIGGRSMQGTAVSPDGDVVNSIRPLGLGESNYSRLTELDDYYFEALNTLPEASEIKSKIDTLKAKKYQSRLLHYVAAVLGGGGFCVMFGCNYTDCTFAAIACILVAALGEIITKLDSNTLLHNAVVSLAAEFVIIGAAKLGLCQHPDRITIGVIMLLISGLGISNGIWYIISRESELGAQKIRDSVIGALGIAIGISIPLLVLGIGELEEFTLHPNFIIQTASCIIACVGFGLWFSAEKKHLPYIAAGACLCWLTYSAIYAFIPGIFIATLGAALVESFFALWISFKQKFSLIVVTTVAIFPLIPGPNLFYLLYGLVSGDKSLMASEGIALLVICVAIAFGNSVVQIIISRMACEDLRRYIDHYSNEESINK